MNTDAINGATMNAVPTGPARAVPAGSTPLSRWMPHLTLSLYGYPAASPAPPRQGKPSVEIGDLVGPLGNLN